MQDEETLLVGNAVQFLKHTKPFIAPLDGRCLQEGAYNQAARGKSTFLIWIQATKKS